jgi:hypothetical protein
MSDNRWDQQGIPHKGWNCVDVIDIRADGDAVNKSGYATC